MDIDQAVTDGTITPDVGAKLKRRSRDAMVAYAINVALFVGIAMVIGGATYWLDDRRLLSALGLVLAIFGLFALTRGGERVRPVANATAIIGATLALGAFASLLFDAVSERLFVGTALGLPVALLGWIMQKRWPESLSLFGGWNVLLGAGVHIFGVLTTESPLSLEWLALTYAGAIAITCGVLLDVRFVTAIAIVPLAAALSSRTFYTHASYGVAIYEVTLTILQMSAIAALALLVSIKSSERIARHARTLGQVALIWTNVAFWIGSLWGDVIGLHLWGPRWEAVIADIRYSDWKTKLEAWAEAIQAFKAQALVIPADVFAAVWAIGILGIGAWGASTSRRAVLNIAVSFGAIHFYTQYFERLKTTPEAIVVAGVIAILGSWALWTVNRRLARH